MRNAAILLSGVAAIGMLPSSLLAAAGVTDQQFVDYYIEPCLLGPAALTSPPYNWTNDETVAYGDAVCAQLIGGGYTSAEGYSSASGVAAIGAQTSTSEAVAKQQADSIQDRLDELQDEEDPTGGWGLLLSLQGGETERDDTTHELGYDSDLEGAVIGLDYRFNDDLVAGAAFGVTKDEADYDGNAGDLETESQSLIAYLTYLIGAGGYINGYVGYAQLDYDNTRKFTIDGDPGGALSPLGIRGTVKSDYEGDQTMAGISGGYDWYSGNYSVGWFANWDYSETDTDGYEEEGNTGFELEYPDQDTKSSAFSLGVNGSLSIDVGWGALIPNASLAAVYEDEQDAQKFAAKLVLIPDQHPTDFILETDDPDRHYGIATLGLVLATHSGAQYFITYEKLLEHDFYETWSLSGGVLIEF
jgi:uncharacterized protein YhjY with autotransporter beta-barrel domain